MPHKVEKSFKDVGLSCLEIKTFIEGVSFEDFLENRMLQSALLKGNLKLLEKLYIDLKELKKAT